MSSPSLYADLSRYYDHLCSAIDYKEQCEFALRVHQVFGNDGRRYLDLACGSGAHLEHLSAAGFICAGLDMSADMLALTAQRCPQAQLYLKDMSELHLQTELDFITCFLYSIHYSHPLARFEQTLQRVHTALAPGGVFCFDAVDKHSIANDAGHAHQMMFEQQILQFQTRWFYNGKGDELDLHIQIRDQHQQYSEQHLMTALSVTQIQTQLLTLGFTVHIFERDFGRLLPWQEKNGNVLICAVKSDAS